MSERHDGAIFSPSRPTASKAVALFTEKEETRINDSLTGEWVRGEAFYGWLGDPIHEAEMFVPSFVPWTNLSFQIVNEGSVRAKRSDELAPRIIDLCPAVTVVSLAWIPTLGNMKRLPSNREYTMDVRSFECWDPVVRSWVSLEVY